MSDPVSRHTNVPAGGTSTLEKLLSWADWKVSQLLVAELLEELELQDLPPSSGQVAELAFDLTVTSYLDYMLKAKAKADRGDSRDLLKGFRKWRTAEKQPTRQGLANYVLWVELAAMEHFEEVPRQIRDRLYSFLSGCRDGSIGLDEAAYDELLGQFLLDDRAAYERLAAPAGHPFASHTLLELVSPSLAARVVAYLETRYAGRKSLTEEGKLAEKFADFAREMGGMPVAEPLPS